MAIGNRTRSTKRRNILKQARKNLIIRTARVWSKSGQFVFSELNKITQAWVKKVLKETEKNISVGNLLNPPDIPSKAIDLIYDVMRNILAYGYWLQHVYMRECKSAIENKNLKVKITLSDIGNLDDNSIREALLALINDRTVENSSDWHDIIPEDAVNWLRGYTPRLTGNLQHDILEKIREVLRDSMFRGTSINQRLKDLRAAEPKILEMTRYRVETIARTEITRADTMGRLIAMGNNPDVLGVEFSAVLDDRTTDICESRHGLIMRLDDIRLPYNTPPLHPNCRSLLLAATIYEYPDGLLTSHEFDEVITGIQRLEDIEEVEKLLSNIRAGIKEQDKKREEQEKQDKQKKQHLNIPEAKTIREANKIAVEYGIAKNANFKGLDVSAVNELIAGVARAKEIFPELETFDFVGSLQTHYNFICYVQAVELFQRNREYWRGKTGKLSDKEIIEAIRKRIKTKRAKKDTWATAFGGTGYKGISLNANKFSPDIINFTLYSELRNSVKSKFHPVSCDTIKSVIDHEMGHQIDYLLDASNDRYINSLYNKLNTFDAVQMSENLSEYANKNIKEFIAEAWAEYQNNPNPRTTAKEVAERLITLRKERFNR